VRGGKTPKTEGISFWQLERGLCRFPLWGNQRVTLDQKRFCGAETRDGESYCAFHDAMVHKSEDGD
ncbi:MAG: hypothetical protein MI923_09535, partial [Phycisphaerales bacterium]|nr:hypothetical protein [Phycisphaerales bacterium]